MCISNSEPWLNKALCKDCFSSRCLPPSWVIPQSPSLVTILPSPSRISESHLPHPGTRISQMSSWWATQLLRHFITSVLCHPAVTSNGAQFNILQGCMGNRCPWTPSSIIQDPGRAEWLGSFSFSFFFFSIIPAYMTKLLHAKEEIRLVVHTHFLTIKTLLYMLSLFLPWLVMFNNCQVIIMFSLFQIFWTFERSFSKICQFL